MAGFFDFLPLLIAQQSGRQQLERLPEPSQLTDSQPHVEQYDRVMATKLVIAYMMALDVIHRAGDGTAGSALDLACGPGHFTLCLAKYLDYSRVCGVDLSPPMVATANRNAVQMGLAPGVTFQLGDATRLEGIPAGEFSLCTLTEGAHHMPDAAAVTQVFGEMDRVTRSDGLIVVMDLVRLRTAPLTEKYVAALGHDYAKRGLPHFLEDFRNSMYASWTPDELYAAIPRYTRRWWYHLVPRGLPTLQIVVGLPAGRRRLFLKPSWPVQQHPLVAEWAPRWQREVEERWCRDTLFEFRMLRTTLQLGSRRCVPPAA